ncbi:MAG: hypothetical protein IJQ73_15880 [Kiritimatiellae bacterium]|nr:hypothetical protein [Kiritimatiellia bacterium]
MKSTAKSSMPWQGRPEAVVVAACCAALFVCGCRSTAFRAVEGDIFRRDIRSRENTDTAKAAAPEEEGRPRTKIVVSADRLFADDAPGAPSFDSEAANAAVEADNAGDFSRAYEIIRADPSPICKALLANYLRYSRPGLELKPDAAAADAICREIIAAVPAESGKAPYDRFHPHPKVPDDVRALREAWRLLSFADYAGLCANAAHACIPPDTRPYRISDLFYDGGPFAAFAQYPFWNADQMPVPEFGRRLRDAAIRGNERARRAFADDGSLDDATVEYRRQGVIRIKRFEYLPLEGAPGFGLEGSNTLYAASPALEALMRPYGFEAHWFHVGHPADGDPAKDVFEEKVRNDLKAVPSRTISYGCDSATSQSIPFLLRRAAPGRKLPLVIYMPGNGEQGTDLALQFRQRAVMDKVSTPEFQVRHPCHLLIPMPPSYGNCNMADGYPVSPGGDLNNAYCDLIFQLMRDGLAVDRSRIYLVGLGSGGGAAIAMALDHPGRFAAVGTMWAAPETPIFHPDRPGNWWFGEPSQVDDPKNRKFFEAVVGAVRGLGGDAVFEFYAKPEKGCWWDPPWQGDRFWDWLFAKTTKGETGR